MMESVKYSCAFVLHKKNSQDQSHLMCRLRWDGSRNIVTIAVGYVVDPEKWETSSQRCRRNSFHGKKKVPAAVINREIERFDAAAATVFAQLLDSPDPKTVGALMRAELGLRTEAADKPMTVEVAFNDFLLEGKTISGWSDGTLKKLRTLRGHIKGWNENAKFSDFSEDGLISFCSYLSNDLELANSTVLKTYSNLQWFLGWACRKHYMTDRTFEDWSPNLKAPKGRIIFLTWDELMRVWNYKPKFPYLDRARDFFCFCAFSSLRYSDAMNLRWSDVHEDSIFVVTKKTDDPLEIDLNKWTRQIIKKYRPEQWADEYVLPRFANQVLNKFLKTLMKECGIDEPVHVIRYDKDGRTDEVKPKYKLVCTHTARRTFICNALMMGIAPDIVMKWTGHNDYRAMKPYIDIADSVRREAMSIFDKK